eukprot:SAG31_NODE_6646_length_1940_cov_1.537751_1_plen_151_part_00
MHLPYFFAAFVVVVRCDSVSLQHNPFIHTRAITHRPHSLRSTSRLGVSIEERPVRKPPMSIGMCTQRVGAILQGMDAARKAEVLATRLHGTGPLRTSHKRVSSGLSAWCDKGLETYQLLRPKGHNMILATHNNLLSAELIFKNVQLAYNR